MSITRRTGEPPFCSAPGSVTLVAFPRFHPEHRGSHRLHAPGRGALKRSADVMIAIILVVLLAPLLTLIASLIYLTMGRPILFSHNRVQFRGLTFKCYKFRTMVSNAREELEVYLRQSPEAAEEWKLYHKLKIDPRVKPLGKLLRKASLDELPQLINVLRGEMSFVGPRPVTADELCRYKSSQRYYLQVRPGITGLWQVSGRSSTCYSYRVALDRKYVASWSLGLDIKIIIKTLPAVIRFHESA